LPDAREKLRSPCLLLDIEGTTTPVDFVYRVLFPYARLHFRDFLQEHWESGDVKPDVEALRSEHLRDAGRGLNLPSWKEEPQDSLLDSVTAYGQWLIDGDSKSTALKSLQGRIWNAGYLSGELRGRVYPDVPVAFNRWSGQGRKICIFSSGSVLAQKLLFSNSTAGDLTRLIADYFDTAVGPKKEPKSYGRIAQALELQPSEILFVSDVVAELDAAHTAGMGCALCVRQDRSETAESEHRRICTFDELFP